LSKIENIRFEWAYLVAYLKEKSVWAVGHLDPPAVFEPELISQYE
jgi:hypothetical protein